MTAAFARLNYFLYPSFYSDWVYIGDAFRLLFYLLILLAVIREIGRYWQTSRRPLSSRNVAASLVSYTTGSHGACAPCA